MSELCLFDITKSKLPYNVQEQLCRELVLIALNANKGIHFNVYNYVSELVESADIKEYFFVTDCFLHFNAEFLGDSLPVVCIFDKEEQSGDVFDDKKRFLEGNAIILLIIEKLIEFGIKEIDIYLDFAGEGITKKDYKEIVCKKDEFLELLYKEVCSEFNESLSFCIQIRNT